MVYELTNIYKHLKIDKTPLGELAIWIKRSDSFPKQEKLTENILSYFSSMSNISSNLEIIKNHFLCIID